MIKRILFALVGLCIATAAHAQAVIFYKQAPGAGFNPVPVSVATPLPVTGTFSSTISGGFTDAAIGTPIAVTTGGVTGTLPAGAAVVATNVGTTNGAYCHLGGTATTSDQYLSPNGGWFAYQVGAATQLTCITSASTTTVNMVGGSGLPTGTGGGGGGSAIIGNVRIDQTTPGTTNGVQINAALPAGTNTVGNVGQNSQYPVGSTAVTASATGTTGATTATLAAVASNYNFVCGYSIRANAAAATTVSDTLTGIISGTMTHELWVAPSASGIGVDEQIFNPCIPGSAVNTAIAAVSGAPGTSGLVSSTIWGYYKTTSP